MDITNKINELKGLSPEQAMQLASSTLPPWIMLGLVLMMAWKLADLSWLFAPQGVVIASEPSRASAQPAAQSGGASVDVRSIQGIFGTARPDDVPVIDDSIALEVNTDFDLFGIVARTSTSDGLAIIAERNGESMVYAPGDAINSRVSLDSVHAHHVIIVNGGVRERLELPQEADSAASPQRRTAMPSRRPTPRTTQRRSAQSSPQAVLDLSDPAKLTDLIRPQPVFNNGKQVGYRVYPGRKRQQFVQLGLKPGDLITDINGTQLDDPAKGMDIFKTLSTSSQVSVTVQRNGASEVLVLDTQQLVNMTNSDSDNKER